MGCAASAPRTLDQVTGDGDHQSSRDSKAINSGEAFTANPSSSVLPFPVYPDHSLDQKPASNPEQKSTKSSDESEPDSAPEPPQTPSLSPTSPPDPMRSVPPLSFPAIPAFKSDSGLAPREFTFAELEEATDSFCSELVLGEGGFGKVYKGYIEQRDRRNPERFTKREVAVKKLNQEGLQGFNEWLTEVIFLRRLHHPHLVHLVGYCTEGGEGLLVYEFMHNASLDLHLFSETGRVLTWSQRVQIALGAAQGLAYLHEGTERSVIFRDLKAGNILLDHDFTAKLSDFGLAKDGPAGDKTHVSTKVVGTYGYTAPEYMQTGHLTSKSDVYAFGVVLLELLSGRRAVDMNRPWEERSLVFWAKPFLADRRRLAKLVDPRLGGQYPEKGATKFAISAHCCLLDVKSRPSMTDMVQTLKALADLSEGEEARPRMRSFPGLGLGGGGGGEEEEEEGEEEGEEGFEEEEEEEEEEEGEKEGENEVGEGRHGRGREDG